ncbi:hypothetical protein AS850_00340 [Frondihabitans sp. 762G35]|uniref:hypothetical protein n=1 Tax=Frondihabitans sp. 762G35 TaxID=1446794 RepID=UPI000D221523|nr:hypothetical protein [Frondihabitans sp. 762G35]ARC55523.1 hypothetical protein AS850_00340 [Frondihabitans sp. 762G35]
MLETQNDEFDRPVGGHGATIPVPIALTEGAANYLRHTACRNFFREQRDRFDILGAGTAADDPVFDQGTMMFCDSNADAILLHAFEVGSGHTARLIYDNAEGDMGVLSSRCFLYNDLDHLRK